VIELKHVAGELKWRKTRLHFMRFPFYDESASAC